MRTFLMLALFAFQPGTADPRVGSWTLVSAQSTMDPANRLTITPVENGTHVRLTRGFGRGFDYPLNIGSPPSKQGKFRPNDAE